MAMNRDLPGMECRHTLDEFAMSPQSGQQTPSLPTIASSLMIDLLVTKLNACIVQQDRADSGSSGTEAEASTRRGDETPSHNLMMDLLVTKLNARIVQQDRADSRESSGKEAEASTRRGAETHSSEEGEALRRQDAPLTLGSLEFQSGPSVDSCFPLTRQLAPLELGDLGEVPLVRQFAPLNLGVGANRHSAAQHLTRQRAPLTLGCMSR
eukprot:CAMPEP_0204217504 /NCGR_PEP_ID=MMETSP0361-20130328/78954_1 /ASSEMBLY_ACC=CAM_ASM_000343 /TAXON_ID=268821 /ORGANISM="Scrippsiella Hangoei, Strain SHTV-5" /LENGTH=209 /DNA_ID=CAMNT_0051182519 /DNA_START=73 /DNA_END=702 /DNA_ORIENTATION=-